MGHEKKIVISIYEIIPEKHGLGKTHFSFLSFQSMLLQKLLYKLFCHNPPFFHKKSCYSVFYSFLCFCKNRFWTTVKWQHDGKVTEKIKVHELFGRNKQRQNCIYTTNLACIVHFYCIYMLVIGNFIKPANLNRWNLQKQLEL